jgi:hypothetical protein
MGQGRAVKKSRLRIVREIPFEHDAGIEAVLLDRRLRFYYTSPHLDLCDMIWLVHKRHREMLERVAERRRLRFFSIEGTLPADSSRTAKRVVLA